MQRLLLSVASAATSVILVASPAHVARADSQEGPNGYAAAVINKSGNNYDVNYTCVDYSADNTYTVVVLVAVDSESSRRFRDVYLGGAVENESQSFSNRGDVVGTIVCEFHRGIGPVESNQANPLELTFP